jgi:ABC-type transporter Mla subunit MlaD
MKENRSNAVIAIGTVLAAILMAAALSYAIGKWSFGNHGYELIIRFPNATGITSNSQVKYAGAAAGRVKEVRLIPRKEQTQDPQTKLYNCVEVVIDVNNDIEIGEDATATIKQDGIGLSAKYVLLTPGPDHNSKALADGALVQGETPFDLTDLIEPAGVVLDQTKSLITSLGPVMNRFDVLSQKMETDLPPMLANANKFLVDGDGAISNFNTPETKERINSMLASLRVATENLKVVSSNAKALTATLAEKPWRVFWGGSTVQPPSESSVLRSNDVIPLKQDVEVNAAPKRSSSLPAQRPGTPLPTTAKPATPIN